MEVLSRGSVPHANQISSFNHRYNFFDLYGFNSEYWSRFQERTHENWMQKMVDLLHVPHLLQLLPICCWNEYVIEIAR